jgi:hypothetical protein
MNARGWIVALLCLLATSVSAQPPQPAVSRAAKPPAPVQVRTSVSRTAVWVGDPITYTVELTCPPKIDILTDDLAAERLPLTGLELLGSEPERDASNPERLIHRVRYRLAAYEPEAASIGVGAIPVRYYVQEAGKKADDVVPAGEVKVPPLVLSLRSTIAEGTTAELRDDRSMRPLPGWVHFARPVGIGLVVLAAAPVALWAAGLIQRARLRARSGGPPRQSRSQRVAALKEIQGLDVSSPEALRHAYGRLDEWIRSNLQQSTGVAALALTPAEIGAAVTRPRRALQMDQVQRVLLECERAKYSPDAPSADNWQTILLEAEQSMGFDAR